MSNKIIIIGAAGMLGQELAKLFYQDELWLWDIKDLDITREQRVFDKINQVMPDFVINAAAFNDVDGAEKNQAIAEKVNGLAVGYLAKAVKAVNGVLIHYSTDYVFDGINQAGYREDSLPYPISAYGRSKLLGEQELQKNMEKFYLIRLSRLFGKAGATPSAKKSFVELMLELAKSKTEINVINEEMACPTYAPDLAKQTLNIINEKKPFGIYHATNSNYCTWHEFAKEIFTIKNINVKLNPVNGDFFPRLAKRPKYSVLINTKLTAMRSWQEALCEYLT